MTITKEDLKDILEDFTRVLDMHSLFSLKNLESSVNKNFTGNMGDVHITLRPSENNTEILTVSYVVYGQGIPAEFKINKELGYSIIILKASDEILGYSLFTEDIYNNKARDKVIKSIDLAKIREELNSVSESF